MALWHLDPLVAKAQDLVLTFLGSPLCCDTPLTLRSVFFAFIDLLICLFIYESQSRICRMSLMLSGVFFSWVMYLGETTVEVDILLKTSQSRTGGRVIAAVSLRRLCARMKGFLSAGLQCDLGCILPCGR